MDITEGMFEGEEGAGASELEEEDEVSLIYMY
jgi:hypothetical protein